MKKTRLIALLLTLALVVCLFAGCGKEPAATPEQGETPQAEQPSATPAGDRTIKIGIVNPTTGKLAGFGEGCQWTEDLIVNYVNDTLGGIYIKEYDAKLPIQIIVYDSTSDTTVCAEMAQKLCEEDKVDLIIARHTPETVNPVAAVAERYGVPCIGIEGPTDAVAGAGPYEVTYHSFWTLETMYKQYQALWTLAGYGPNQGYKVGLAFANDADGTAWHSVFAKNIVANGYELVDPGQYPDSTNDFSDIINTFKNADIDILSGTNITPNFADLWSQAKNAGLQPAVVTMGKAYLLESDALAIGADLMDGLMAEVWWSPTHPYVSALTGMTCAELTEKYASETGSAITQPMGYKYASMELAVTALTAAESLNADDIVKAISEIDTETIVGPIKYDQEFVDASGNLLLHYSNTAVCGGQWQRQDDGSLKLVIIDNSLYPEIQTTGEYRAISY